MKRSKAENLFFAQYVIRKIEEKLGDFSSIQQKQFDVTSPVTEVKRACKPTRVYGIVPYLKQTQSNGIEAAVHESFPPGFAPETCGLLRAPLSKIIPKEYNNMFSKDGKAKDVKGPRIVPELWHNGEWINWDDARVHVMSHVLHYGSSVFEGIRCYKTKRGPRHLSS